MDLITAQLPAITERCRHLGWISPGTSLAAPSSAGDGNMNRTLRVHLEGRGPTEPATLILKQALPYVAKYPDIPAPIARGATEAAFYQCIAQDRELCRRTPALYGFDSDHRLLCMEDLGSGAVMTHLYGASAGDEPLGTLMELVHWLSRLHALTVRASEFPDNMAMRALNHEHIFVVPFNPESGVELAVPLADLRRSLSVDQTFLAKAKELGDLYLGATQPRSQPALLHGDFYPGSWLSNGQSGARVIDPEFGFVGPAEFDLGVMLAHLMFAGFDEPALQSLTAQYTPPPGFDHTLARQFAAIEVLRRLLGVAQLPLTAEHDTLSTWAHAAKDLLVSTA